jgi:threonine aldolase
MPANFGSDNSSGVHPSIIEALAKPQWVLAPAYGADALTKKVGVRD